jgi:uncharacterized protein (DUF952 family)
MATVWHLTDPDTWMQARSRGVFSESTRGASIEQVGFLHGSYADQLALVTSFVYDDVTGPMVALGIDPALLVQHGLELRDEPGDPDDPTPFPHVYGGDLPLDVITKVIPVTVTDGVLVGWPPPTGDGD